MHEIAATPSWVLIAYLVSGVCFILALRGLFISVGIFQPLRLASYLGVDTRYRGLTMK